MWATTRAEAPAEDSKTACSHGGASKGTGAGATPCLFSCAGTHSAAPLPTHLALLCLYCSGLGGKEDAGVAPPPLLLLRRRRRVVRRRRRVCCCCRSCCCCIRLRAAARRHSCCRRPRRQQHDGRDAEPGGAYRRRQAASWQRRWAAAAAAARLLLGGGAPAVAAAAAGMRCAGAIARHASPQRPAGPCRQRQRRRQCRTAAAVAAARPDAMCCCNAPLGRAGRRQGRPAGQPRAGSGWCERSRRHSARQHMLDGEEQLDGATGARRACRGAAGRELAPLAQALHMQGDLRGADSCGTIAGDDWQSDRRHSLTAQRLGHAELAPSSALALNEATMRHLPRVCWSRTHL